MPNIKQHRVPRNNHEDDHNNNFNGNQQVNNPPERIMEQQNHICDENARFQHCCVPTGCSDDPIDITNPYDAVKVVCNNDACTEGNWMHKGCFVMWEQSVLSFLRSCGRARSWSEKQRLQNLWTKKGYDLAYKACDCKCSRGHLRKDLDYIPRAANDNARKVRKNKKKNDKPMPVVSTNHKPSHNSTVNPHHSHVVDNHHHQHLQHPIQSFCNDTKVSKKEMPTTHHPTTVTNIKPHGGEKSINNNSSAVISNSTNRSRNNSIDHNYILENEVLDNDVHLMTYANHPLMLQNDGLRLRTNSVSSTGSVGSQASSSTSSPSSAGSPSPLSSSPGNGNIFTKSKRESLDLIQTGIFRHRQDLSAFSALPRSKQNPYNIHIEDVQEDEDTRNFVLSNLTNKRMTALRCVLCKTQLPVFDRFPLIDGTMFLSPQAYDQFVVQVIWEGRIQFLNAVCINCLHGASESKCSSCKTPWNGTSFVVGTMYTYDIFAAMPCCQKRLTCKHCHRAVIDVSVGLYYYSQYSRMIICPYCKANDYHFIRSLGDTFTMKELICAQH
uniref:Uncharacterized protein n=1 Tax=Arion vulgaris TaxID=1028688 RepID=A0A0B7B7T6_9EUPU